MMPVAILAGGLATRMRPQTDKIPKALLNVVDEPFIGHQLRLLRRKGVSNVVLCVGYLGEMLERHVGDGGAFRLDVRYSRDGKEPLGTGGALKNALSLLGEQFMVLYGDSWLEIDYAAVADAFLQSGMPALMTVYRNRGMHERSNAIFRDGRIFRYDKRKPAIDMEYIDYGLGCFQSSILRAWPEDIFDLADVYAALAASRRLAGYEAATRFYEIGSREGLWELESHLSDHHALSTSDNPVY
jgi:NDP-sugar pyrophosphorylase family protein